MMEDNHIFQGLKRDNHPIRQEKQFLWDAHNIRLTHRDDSTLLSITNEKGPAPTGIEYLGNYVGHCTVGNYLVVFTCYENKQDESISKTYRIYRTLNNSNYSTNLLFEYHDEGCVWNKGWTPEHPIEAIGYIETDLIQKVYWIDDVNQPRVINITKAELTGTSDFSNLYDKDSFDFIRTLNLTELITVEKLYNYGEFSPGIIQYAMSYYDKYGQESNIFYVTPIHYIANKDRAGNGEGKILNSFKINIINPDNFDYVRVYSIHRTSIDAVPTVKVVEDIDISLAVNTEYGKKLELIDNGTKGYVIDSTRLLYVGGSKIIAGTMAQKDNTMFFGNIEHTGNVYEEVKNLIQDNFTLADYEISEPSDLESNNTYYEYYPKLNEYNARFKTGEKYRCGIQAQFNDGTWTDPVFIKDEIICDRYRWNNIGSILTKSVVPKNDTAELRTSLKNLGIRRLRSCVVFPQSNEREILCQGVLSPTLYFTKDRKETELFNISSWFFRPIIHNIPNKDTVPQLGSVIPFNHDDTLLSDSSRGAEIQGTYPASETTANIDENTLTFHSPDIEFDTDVQNFIWDDTYVRIIGVALLGAISGDISIETSSPAYDVHGSTDVRMQGFTTGIDPSINGGLVSGLFYKDGLVPTSFDIPEGPGTLYYFPVYPWHRSGSLNNDKQRPADKGQRTAVLKKKVISNLKFFNINKTASKILKYDITVPQLFMSNELELLRFQPMYLNQSVSYMGNVDKLLLPKDYNLYHALNSDGVYTAIGEDGKIKIGNDPVRIKYKSTPHLMFSLKGNDKDWPILPRVSQIDKPQDRVEVEPAKDTKIDYSVTVYTKDDIDDVLKYITFSYPPPINASSDGLSIIEVYQQTSGHPTTHNTNWYNALCVPNGTKWAPASLTKDTYILKVDSNTVFSNYSSGSVSRYRGLRRILNDSDFDSSGNYIGPERYLEIKVKRNEENTKNKILSINNVTDLVDLSTDETPKDTYIRTRDYFSIDSDNIKPYLLIAEVCRKQVLDKFGGKTEEALKANRWFPAGEPVSIDSDNITVPFLYGDTWYARYDCLKTYPFTHEDENQIVEIGSFMCETRVNIDGRYDRNRGRTSNLNMTPENFNKINEVYSQYDSFFNYRILDEDFYKTKKFENQVIWSMGKSPGEEIDTWTNVTLANTLDMDGQYGKVTGLEVFNDNIFCLQDKAFSNIMFNSRVQIPVTDGVPIEISNSNKVDGYRYLSNTIGCQNKWSAKVTPKGIYFIDDYTDSLWMFNGQLADISENLGMDWWFKANHSHNVWKPVSSENNGIRTFYDSRYSDVYFVPGPDDNERYALCFSEQLNQFVSQYSYGGTEAMFQFKDKFLSLRNNGNNTVLYKNFEGQYNDFFGDIKGWDISFISNDNPMNTKIFDTIELATDHWNGNRLLNSFPMNYINIDNEYQKAYSVIDSINMRKKFRIWRGLIPRNTGTRQRIRNPWSRIELGWSPKLSDDKNNKAIIHNVSVKYTL